MTDQPESRTAYWEAAALTAGCEVDQTALRAYMAVADAERTAVLREVAAAALREQVAEVWIVWLDDEPVLGHYSDEVTAKLAAIEWQQEAEGPGHDFVYAWTEYGGHVELLANGDYTGFRVKRERVLGENPSTAQVDEMARLRAVDAAYAALVHRALAVNDEHLIDAIARANRETAAEAEQPAP